MVTGSKPRKIRKALLLAGLAFILAAYGLVLAQEAADSTAAINTTSNISLNLKVNKSGDNITGDINILNGHNLSFGNYQNSSIFWSEQNLIIQPDKQSSISRIIMKVNNIGALSPFVLFNNGSGTNAAAGVLFASNVLTNFTGGIITQYIDDDRLNTALIFRVRHNNALSSSTTTNAPFYIEGTTDEKDKIVANTNITVLKSGKGFILKSADGTRCGFIYWGNDDTLKSNSITCP